MPSQKLVRATAAAAVAIAAMSAVSYIAATPAAAVEFWVHEFNLANGAKEETNGAASADVVVYAVGYAQVRPIAVALSEVCRSQYDRICASLSRWGYTGYHTETVRETAKCPGARGNALFVLGNVTRKEPNQFDIQNTAKRERRDYVCMEANIYYNQWVACSTHLDVGPSIAKDQLAEYAYSIQMWFGSRRTIPAGDFNIDPGTSALEPMRLHHINVGGTAATPGSGRKIDYVWVDKGMAYPSTTARITNVGSSDHHYFETSAHW